MVAAFLVRALGRSALLDCLPSAHARARLYAMRPVARGLLPARPAQQLAGRRVRGDDLARTIRLASSSLRPACSIRVFLRRARERLAWDQRRPEPIEAIRIPWQPS